MTVVEPVASCRPGRAPAGGADLSPTVESGGRGLPASPVTGAGRESAGGDDGGDGGASAGFAARDVVPGALAGFGAGGWTGSTGVPVAPDRPGEVPDDGEAFAAMAEGAPDAGGTVCGVAAESAAPGGGEEGGAPTAAALSAAAGGVSGAVAGALGARSRVARNAPSPRTTRTTAARPIQRDELRDGWVGAAAAMAA